MNFFSKINERSNKIVNKIESVAQLSVDMVIQKVKDLYNNAESVAILTLGSLGTSHFVGSYVFANEALAALFFAEMLGPIVAIGIIWGLLKLAIWRRQHNYIVQVAKVA